MVDSGFATLFALFAGALVDGEPAAPPVIACAESGDARASAIAQYNGLESRIDDDQTPVENVEFQTALNAARAADARLEQWRAPTTPYPAGALAQAKVAACVGMFDVATNGMAINIVAACTDSYFEPTVRRAIAAALFLPQKSDGAPIPARRVMQAFHFCLGD